MGTTTFSGPIKAGTIKETTGTSLGSNIKNTGQVVMAQTFSTGSLAGGASAANVTDVVIPANSQIIDCVIDCPTAMGNATVLPGQPYRYIGCVLDNPRDPLVPDPSPSVQADNSSEARTAVSRLPSSPLSAYCTRFLLQRLRKEIDSLGSKYSPQPRADKLRA